MPLDFAGKDDRCRGFIPDSGILYFYLLKRNSSSSSQQQKAISESQLHVMYNNFLHSFFIVLKYSDDGKGRK